MYADMEYLLENVSTCRNDPNKLSAMKINEQTHSGYSWLKCCSFDNTKNRLGYYRSKDCMKMLCKDLKNMQKE